MERIIRKLKIRTMDAQVALCQLTCESLAKQFESQTLSEGERAKIGKRWDKILREKRALEFALDLLEKQQGQKNSE